MAFSKTIVADSVITRLIESQGVFQLANKATLENCSVMNCFFNNEPDIDDTNEPALYSAGFGWNIPNDITAHIE
ncbi:MAG TPA: hypothetical protein VK004_04170, partial [Ignavibacteria bacterium]|nr:hypothetical protein [Ignavibacteria bacterium]